MSDSVAWCILAGFKIVSVFSRITYHIIESLCEFSASILEEYVHRGKKTLSVNVTKKVQHKKEKGINEVGCQNEEGSENKHHNRNANEPTITRKNKTEDKNGDTLTISGQRFCFRGTDKKFECNLRDARKVTVSFDFYPFQDQSFLEFYDPSTLDRTSETAEKVTTSDEPLLPTSANHKNQLNESEVTRMYRFKREGDYVSDNSCPDQKAFKADYRKHAMKNTEVVTMGPGSTDGTESELQRTGADADKMQKQVVLERRNPIPAVYMTQCPTTSVDQIQSSGPPLNQKKSSEATIDPKQCPDAADDQKKSLEEAVHQQQGPEAIVVQQVDPEATVDQQQGLEASVDQQQDPEATVDQQQVPEAIVDQQQQQGPEASVDHQQDPQAIVDQQVDPEATVDQHQGSEAITGQQVDPEATVDQQQGPEAIVVQQVDPEATVDQQQGPVAIVVQQVDPEATIDQQQGPETFVDQQQDQQQGPEASVDQQQDPEAIVDQQQEPEAIVDKQQDLEAAVDKEKGPETIVDQQQLPEAIVDKQQDPETIVDQQQDQQQGPEAIVDKQQDPEAVVDQEKGPETNVDLDNGPDSTVSKKEQETNDDQKNCPAASVHQNQSHEVSVEQKEGFSATNGQQKGSAVAVDQGPMISVDQKLGLVTHVDQLNYEKQISAPSIDKKRSPVVPINNEQGKMRTPDQFINKKIPQAPVENKQDTRATVYRKLGAAATSNKKNSAAAPEKKQSSDGKKGDEPTVEEKHDSVVPTGNKKGTVTLVDTKKVSEVPAYKIQSAETYVGRKGTADCVDKKQVTVIPTDNKKGASVPVDKKEGLEVPVDKKHGSVVSVDQNKGSPAQIDQMVDKRQAPVATVDRKEGSAANVHQTTGKKHGSAPSSDQKQSFSTSTVHVSCKEKDLTTRDFKRKGSTPSTYKKQVESKREPENISSAADRKSVSRGVKDKSNLKYPQGGLRVGEATQTLSKVCDTAKVLQSASEGSAGTKVGASETPFEASQSASGVEQVPETSRNVKGIELDSKFGDADGTDPIPEESECADSVELVSEMSVETENFADVSEGSRKGEGPELVFEVLGEDKAVEPDSKTFGDENNGGLYQESLADRSSHQRKYAVSDYSCATSDDDSVNNSDNVMEKGPSIVIAPDVLLNPYMPLNMTNNSDQNVQKTGVIDKEYLQDEWDDTDKYFYDHVIEREKEMGYFDSSTFAKGSSAQEAMFEKKDRKKEMKSEEVKHESHKSYGRIVDKYNPLTELPKYYDVITVVDSKYLLQKSDIKCYTKQGVTDDSKIAERAKDISDTERSLETEEPNKERESAKEMRNLNLLVEAAHALDKKDSKACKEGQTSQKSGKSFAEMGARPRTYRRSNYP